MSSKRTIWKFELDIVDSQDLELPAHWQVMSMGTQEGNAHILVWLLVDPEAPKQTFRFRCFGTGHPFEGASRHIGTVQVGAMVWHYFEGHHGEAAGDE